MEYMDTLWIPPSLSLLKPLFWFARCSGCILKLYTCPHSLPGVYKPPWFDITLSLSISLHTTQSQYCERALNPHQMRVLSNYSHVSSHYKFALSQYEMAYQENKRDYLLVLCIAIMYINMACQGRHPPKKNAVITQVIGDVILVEIAW